MVMHGDARQHKHVFTQWHRKTTPDTKIHGCTHRESHTPAQMLSQPALDRRLNPVTESTPPSLKASAKEILSIQGHSWSLLRGHQTSGCWLPEPQMGCGGDGPLKNAWVGSPPKRPQAWICPHKQETKVGRSSI